MSDAASARDRALALIDEIIALTLQGKIRSTGQIYRLLVEGLAAGSGELFERCLRDRQTALERDRDIQTDELKLAKVERKLRALKSITAEWQRWQAETVDANQIQQTVSQILTATAPEAILAWVDATDPNRDRPLTLPQWRTIAQRLANSSHEATDPDTVAAIASGIEQGLDHWQELEGQIVSWIYDQAQGALGFGGVPGQSGPWATWSRVVSSPWLADFFQTLAMNESAVDFIERQTLQTADWVDLMMVWRCLQQGLVTWFDQRVYESNVSAKLSISTYLAFAVLWSQVAAGAANSLTKPQALVEGSLQITLQILRRFAQRDYFPLYGGLFASFSGRYLRHALDYLDRPLQLDAGSKEKGRMLTLLGYSQRALGRVDTAIAFHQQALTVAQQAGDRPTEVANLNHLSRTYLEQQAYDEAISYSQRALVLSRQVGDRTGEANALTNLGYSEIFRAQQTERLDETTAETAIAYLQQALQLTERQGDRQSQALCLSSLGVAYLMQELPRQAALYLEGSIPTAQFSGDLHLQGVNLAYLADAYQQLGETAKAIAAGSVSLVLLYQLGSTAWRRAAGLLTILRGQMGAADFTTQLTAQRSQIVTAIGVEGYDSIPDLLTEYGEI